jgi:hypothetical protein
MTFRQIYLLLAFALVLSSPAHAKGALTDAQVKKAIIAESIASYPGNCPCPYNSASNGSSCGGRSAYSRKGGYGPTCYAKDITPQEVAAWRARN